MNDVLYLIEIDETKTAMGGRDFEKTSEKKVFGEKKSVRTAEFYQAHQSGLEVTAVFSIWIEEYNDERIIKHKGKYFTVVRTYEKGDKLEITCQRRKGLFQEAVR